MIRPALLTGVLEGREGLVLAAIALDHDALGTRPVDFAHLHVLNVVVRLDALNHLRQLSSSLFPFPTRERAQQDKTIKAWWPLLRAL